MTRRPALAAFVIAAVVAFPAIFFFVRHQTAKPIAQTIANLAVVNQDSFGLAMERYPKYFAPLYPAVLWGAKRLGVAPEIFNVGVQALVVGLVAAVILARQGAIAATLAALLLVVLYPAARNVFQITADALFGLVAFAAFLVVDRREASLARAAAAGLFAGVAALTRYFGLFWPTLPILAALALAHGTRAQRLSRVAMGGGVALALTAPWLLHVRNLTGHISGMSRQEGGQTGKFEHWNEHRDFATNVAFSAKSVLVDWLSPTRIANHRAMIDERVSPIEWILIAAALLLLGWGALAARRNLRQASEAPRPLHDLFVATFFLSLIGVWSFSNNDPIYSRFVFPAYPFLVVSGFEWARRAGGSIRDRVPFALLYLLCLVPSLVRHARSLGGS